MCVIKKIHIFTYCLPKINFEVDLFIYKTQKKDFLEFSKNSKSGEELFSHLRYYFWLGNMLKGEVFLLQTLPPRIAPSGSYRSEPTKFLREKLILNFFFRAMQKCL